MNSLGLTQTDMPLLGSMTTCSTVHVDGSGASTMDTTQQRPKKATSEQTPIRTNRA